MTEYVVITFTGELAEVIARTPAAGRTPARVHLRKLNMGRCDFGEQGSRYTWSYPATSVRPADMSRWEYVPASNRWVAKRRG